MSACNSVCTCIGRNHPLIGVHQCWCSVYLHCNGCVMKTIVAPLGCSLACGMHNAIHTILQGAQPSRIVLFEPSLQLLTYMRFYVQIATLSLYIYTSCHCMCCGPCALLYYCLQWNSITVYIHTWLCAERARYKQVTASLLVCYTVCLSVCLSDCLSVLSRCSMPWHCLWRPASPHLWTTGLLPVSPDRQDRQLDLSKYTYPPHGGWGLCQRDPCNQQCGTSPSAPCFLSQMVFSQIPTDLLKPVSCMHTRSPRLCSPFTWRLVLATPNTAPNTDGSCVGMPEVTNCDSLTVCC